MGIQESKLKMSTGNVPGIIPVSKYVKLEKLLTKKKYILHVLLVSRLVLLR